MLHRLQHALARAAWVAASFAASSLTVLAVGALFHHAARDPWLRDAPQARENVARCEALDDRGRQQACLRAVVAAARQRDAGATQVASLGAAAAASRRSDR